jgi:hypothetical protein
MYYTVLYREISALRGRGRRYNTNYTVMTNDTRGLRNDTVSYGSVSYSDPALECMVPKIGQNGLDKNREI